MRTPWYYFVFREDQCQNLPHATPASTLEFTMQRRRPPPHSSINAGAHPQHSPCNAGVHPHIQHATPASTLTFTMQCRRRPSHQRERERERNRLFGSRDVRGDEATQRNYISKNSRWRVVDLSNYSSHGQGEHDPV